ncbi:MAG TPA: KH domain-containing protein [Actinomycetota bacterium]|nr:KH domain-containing protein [Actinomycetota bacterium]
MASSVKEVLEYIAKNLVDDPDAVRVTAVEDGDTVSLKLAVASDDVGKVIGRRGRTARAIRDMVRAAGVKAGVNVSVEIEG